MHSNPILRKIYTNVRIAYQLYVYRSFADKIAFRLELKLFLYEKDHFVVFLFTFNIIWVTITWKINIYKE